MRIVGLLFLAAFAQTALATAPTPGIVSSISDPLLDGARGVAVSGHYAYEVGQIANSLVVIDVAVPAAPRIVGAIVDARLNGATGVTVSGGLAYVAARTSNRLVIIDVNDPAHPAILGSVTDPMLGGAAKIVLSGTTAYVTAITANALAIVDVGNPSAPTIVGAVADAVALQEATGVTVVGDYAYVTGSDRFAGRMTVVDVASRSNPRVLSTLLDPRLNGASAVVVSGRYAYVSAIDADALTIVDVSAPANPVITGTVTTGSGVTSPTADLRDVVLLGNYACVIGRANEVFTIIDITHPDNPTVFASITDNRLLGARALAIAGGYAYIAVFNGDALTVVNLFSPPPPPTAVTATASGTTKIDIGWQAVADATKYYLYRSQTPGGPYSYIASVTSGTRYTNSGLSAGTAYFYVVQAVTASGTSANSAEASAVTRTLPAAPTGVQAVATSSTRITLSWQAVSAATKYYVYRSTTPGGPYAFTATATSTTSYINAGLSPGTRYYYVVQAVSADGTSANSSEASAIAN